MQLALDLNEDRAPLPLPVETKGVVYTRLWVVQLMLDLAGYCDTSNLLLRRAVEPAAGDGAFFIPMVRRLLTAWKRAQAPAPCLADALRAYEVDSGSSDRLKVAAMRELAGAGITLDVATNIVNEWIVQGDYLLRSPAEAAADFVIGNPPYIRYDDLPENLLATYRKMYNTMRGRCDIYVAFFEAALAQLKPNGVCAFICADRWMRSAYGAELRRLVGHTAGVEVVIEMHNALAFEDEVSAYPAVTVMRRAPQRAVIVASADATAGTVSPDTGLARAITELANAERTHVPGVHAAKLSTWYSGDDPWPWAEPDALNLLQRLEATCRPLEDRVTGTRVGIGVATGADKVFVTTDSQIVEADRLLPLAMAADTRSGTLAWSGHYLIDPWSADGHLVDLGRYPRLAAYYQAHAGALQRRHIADKDMRGWYRTIDRVHHSLQHREKLYFPDMKLESHPVLDRGLTYPHHNLYFVISDAWDLDVLGGLLLSKVAELFVASYCVKMRGGTLRFQAQYLRRIRVPDPRTMSSGVQDGLREAFTHRDRQLATDMALRAYGLTAMPSVD